MVKNLKICESCALQEGSGTDEPRQGLPEDPEKENSLALVPYQRVDDAPPRCYSIVVRSSNQSKPGWSLLRHVFHPRKHNPKSSLKNTIVFQRPLRQPSWHSSAVVHPDQKQTNIDQNDDSSSTLDGESGAIVPFGSAAAFPVPSLCGDLSSVSAELLEDLNEKYSSSCRLYSLQELASATANFSPGLLSLLQISFPSFLFWSLAWDIL